MPRKRFAILLTISVIIVLVAGFAIYVTVGLGKGFLRLGDNETPQGGFISKKQNSVSGKWNEGVIDYKGEKYIYNSSTRVYLLMGVDKEGPVAPAEDYVSGGQSDAMFLLITDKEKQKISVVPINRNTMTDIELCDQNGHYYGTFKAQICLQHGYGDGLKGSCQKTMEAVSKLFYDVPITGYIAMNMDAMMILNRLAGGVTVEVLEDVDYERFDVHLKEGETVTLTDEEAYAYLRKRDINEVGTANRRLDREKQYALALYERLKEKAGGDKSKALNMYDELEDYIVTNIVFENVAEDLMKYGFSESNMYEIPGETVQGKNFEEFHIDKSALYDIIISILYKRHEGMS